MDEAAEDARVADALDILHCLGHMTSPSPFWCFAAVPLLSLLLLPPPSRGAVVNIALGVRTVRLLSLALIRRLVVAVAHRRKSARDGAKTFIRPNVLFGRRQPQRNASCAACGNESAAALVVRGAEQHRQQRLRRGVVERSL